MKLQVNRSVINEKLDYLHQHPNVRENPTAEPTYKLPKNIYREIIKTKFSTASIQKLSDHIGHFLGLFSSIKVTIGIESSEYMLAASSASDGADRVGLYKVKSGGRREIQLTKKFRFKFEHIMAILVHESMHNYLDSLGIRLDDTDHNEVLTDVSAAYFGLGHRIIEGYEPIIWTTDRTADFGLSTITTTHTFTIGYVPADLIEYAVYRTACIRNLPAFFRICPLRYWMPLALRLFVVQFRKSLVSRKFMTVEKKVIYAQKSLADIGKVLLEPSEHHWKKTNRTKSSALVELHGVIATGEICRTVEHLLKKYMMPKNQNTRCCRMTF